MRSKLRNQSVMVWSCIRGLSKCHLHFWNGGIHADKSNICSCRCCLIRKHFFPMDMLISTFLNKRKSHCAHITKACLWKRILALDSLDLSLRQSVYPHNLLTKEKKKNATMVLYCRQNLFAPFCRVWHKNTRNHKCCILWAQGMSSLYICEG